MKGEVVARANRRRAAKPKNSAVRAVPRYQEDETAWLERTSRLVKRRRFREIDAKTLSEFLSAMADRDRRDAETRLTALLANLLKWQYQSTERNDKWRATIIAQCDDLNRLLGGKTLRHHAEKVLPTAYRRGLELAAIEMGVNEETLPTSCPFTLEQLLEATKEGD